MFIPSIAVAIMAILFQSPMQKQDFGFNLKWIIIALLLMPIAIHSITLPLLWFLRDGHIQWMSTPLLLVIVRSVVGLVLVSFFAFFEEMGWRGWLMPRLLSIMSENTAIIVGALIWALWHVSFALGGVSSAEGLSRYQMLLIPLGTFGAGIIINWLWVCTKNILVVTIAHGSLNNWGQLAFKYIRDDESALPLMIGVDVALILTGIIVMTLRERKEVQFPLDNFPPTGQ